MLFVFPILPDDVSNQMTTRPVNRGLPKLPQLLYQPTTSGVDLLLEADNSGATLQVPVNMDNLQEILTAATASLAGLYKQVPVSFGCRFTLC